MKPFHLMAPFIAGLIAVLTYFLVQGTTIDEPRRGANALQAIILQNAALQRDVLLARAGLLNSYDPLVSSMERLRASTINLSVANEITRGETRADIERRIREVADAVRRQELLVEAFKSDNALLQNSLSYFNHLSGRLTGADSGGRADVKSEVSALTASMLRFINDPGPDARRETEASLERLERLPDYPSAADDIRSLIAHSRLITAKLPGVDELVSGIQAAPTNALVRALQDVYLEAQARASARADVFMVLLYVAALGLVIYIAYLFLRLRANAGILRTRLAFERLIASISTQFINLPREELRSAIGKTLAQLAEHATVAGIRIIVFRGTEADSSRGYSHRRQDTSAELASDRMLQLIRYWTDKGLERQGCLTVDDVDTLPEGREKAALQAVGIRSWLCIPMRVAGECLAVLVLYDTKVRRWRDDDISLLRTAAEIFANAIARERSEVERAELQLHLNRSQRLEAIGTLAGGIAHEFNNILGAVRGYSEMALAVLRRDSNARHHVQQIMKAGERAQDIVEQVLAFGRRREREHKAIDANAVVAEAVDLIRASFSSALSLKTELAKGPATVMGDATELQQVVMNLCTNAAQAMSGRGVLRIGLDSIASERQLELSHGDIPPGDYVRLTVRDTGHGIEPAFMERIFEPFFTTKPGGQGTGLGLSTVHGIVTAHHGGINVESVPGKGTTFEVYLPKIEQPPSREELTNTLVPKGNGETILIVDDDRSLVMLGEEMLAALGYEPIGFEGSGAALAAFRADPARFDLVLTDEIMPEVTGTELARAVHETRPDIPIVLMTGYDRALEPDRLQNAGICEVLKKPLLSQPLGKCLARHLPEHGSNSREMETGGSPSRFA